MRFSPWQPVTLYPAVQACANCDAEAFQVRLEPDHYRLARAKSRVEDSFETGRNYVFSWDVTMEPGVRCQIAYTWLDSEDKPLFRAHGVSGGRVIAPEGAVALEVDVCFSGFSGGTGSIRALLLTPADMARPKWVTLAALMIAGPEHPTPEENIRLAAQRIDAAAAEGADLVLLPETYNTRGVEGLQSFEGAATMEEEAVAMLRRKAQEHRIYTAASVRLREETGLVSNTLVLFDPRGQLVGRYTKAHLTMGELWSGMVPGQEIPVFSTELGRIGCSICWDRFMPEHARVLFMQGADIVLNPTASAEYPLDQAHNGYSNCAFIVTAQTTADPNLTRITGRTGQVLATADPEKGYALARVDVNAVDPVFWLSAPDADTDPRSVYWWERRPELYDALTRKTEKISPWEG